MGLIDCNDGLQPQSWCPKTTDEALPAVLGLLPKGPAWDAGRVPGLPPNQFWRSYAGLFAYTYPATVRLSPGVPLRHARRERGPMGPGVRPLTIHAMRMGATFAPR